MTNCGKKEKGNFICIALLQIETTGKDKVEYVTLKRFCLVCETHFWISYLISSLEICCFPFLQFVLLNWCNIVLCMSQHKKKAPKEQRYTYSVRSFCENKGKYLEPKRRIKLEGPLSVIWLISLCSQLNPEPC